MLTVSIGKPLGITLSGDDAAGVAITKVKAGGNAEATGVVRVGMVLVSIDGASCVGKTKAECVALIKGSAGASLSLSLAGAAGADSDDEMYAPVEAERAQGAAPAAPGGGGGGGAGAGMDYGAMGKLALIKEVRARGIEYARGAGIEVLRKLLQDSDPGGQCLRTWPFAPSTPRA